MAQPVPGVPRIPPKDGLPPVPRPYRHQLSLHMPAIVFPPFLHCCHCAGDFLQVCLNFCRMW